MGKPIIAIVGRPNVGKSMLFNRITGKRLSIVEDVPGVTRDRLYADAEWRNREFSLIDTGGIEPRADSEILKFMREQAEIAIDHADVIIFLADLKTGVTAADSEVASILLRAKKPVVLAVNKSDTPGADSADIYEFYNLGLGDPSGISALHGYGIGDLLDRCFEYLNFDNDGQNDDEYIKVAVIGKPNAGKSSLINRILGEKRVIVSDTAGTTRDTVDVAIENEYGKFMFIDTAGIRKRSKVFEGIEKYSVLRALMAIDRADVCVIMMDAQEGVTEQDTKIAGYAHEKGKGSIILMNKWDLIDKNEKTMEQHRQQVQTALSYMTYAPILFASAKTGQKIDKIYQMIKKAAENNSMRITTGNLNTILSEATAKVQPPSDRGRRLKVYYITQPSVKPPTFVIFCNDAELFHFSYRRYIENQIRDVFGLEGTPIRIIIREKGEKEF